MAKHWCVKGAAQYPRYTKYKNLFQSKTHPYSAASTKTVLWLVPTFLLSILTSSSTAITFSRICNLGLFPYQQVQPKMHRRSSVMTTSKLKIKMLLLFVARIHFSEKSVKDQQTNPVITQNRTHRTPGSRMCDPHALNYVSHQFVALNQHLQRPSEMCLVVKQNIQ